MQTLIFYTSVVKENTDLSSHSIALLAGYKELTLTCQKSSSETLQSPVKLHEDIYLPRNVLTTRYLEWALSLYGRELLTQSSLLREHIRRSTTSQRGYTEYLLTDFIGNDMQTLVALALRDGVVPISYLSEVCGDSGSNSKLSTICTTTCKKYGRGLSKLLLYLVNTRIEYADRLWQQLSNRQDKDIDTTLTRQQQSETLQRVFVTLLCQCFLQGSFWSDLSLPRQELQMRNCLQDFMSSASSQMGFCAT